MRKLIGTLFFASLIINWFFSGVFDVPRAGQIAGIKVLETVQVWFSFGDVTGVEDVE